MCLLFKVFRSAHIMMVLRNLGFSSPAARWGDSKCLCSFQLRKSGLGEVQRLAQGHRCRASKAPSVVFSLYASLLLDEKYDREKVKEPCEI